MDFVCFFLHHLRTIHLNQNRISVVSIFINRYVHTHTVQGVPMITSILRYSAVLILFASITYAQIPNWDFENWTGQTPDGWVTGNAPPLYTNVTASTTSYSGTFAVRGEVVSFYTAAMPPALQVGQGGEGFACTLRPTAITGWYQFYPTGGDIFTVNVGIVKGGIISGIQETVAWAAAELPTAQPSWAQFSVPFTYQSSSTPDTCVMQFMIIGPGPATAYHLGSYFILDHLEFSGSTEIAEGIAGQPLDFRLEQNFPNPFNPSTTIDFSLPARAQTRLVVYNTLGQEVAVLVNGELESGMHSARFDAMGLPSGTYFYRLTAGANMHTGKMNLLK